MALWDGATFAANVAASAFNQILPEETVNFVKKRTYFLSKLMGEQLPSRGGNEPIQFERGRSVRGNKGEVRLIGKLAAPTAVAYGSAEVATATPDFASNIAGGAEFEIANYPYSYSVPRSELDKINGASMKGEEDWLREIVNHYIIPGFMKEANTKAISNANAPAATHIVGLEYIIDTTNTYLLNRSDSANADFRGVVQAAGGPFDMDTVETVVNQVTVNDGNTKMALGGLTVYGAAKSFVQSFTHVSYSADKAKYGAASFEYAGIAFCLENDVTAGNLLLLDTDYLGVVYKNNPVNVGTPVTASWQVNPTNLLIPVTMNMQLWCNKPNAQGKITGITG